MKVSSAIVTIVFVWNSVNAAPPETGAADVPAHEISVVDRNDGVALKLTVSPSRDDSGENSILITIALKNEAIEE